MRKTFTLIFMLFSVIVFAQTKKNSLPCGTDSDTEKLLKENPNAKEIRDLLEKQLKSSAGYARNGGQTTLTIPVVVYVVHSGDGQPEAISDYQVQSQMTALNEYFALSDINFCLAGDDTFTVPLKNPATDVQTTKGIIHVNAPALINHTLDYFGKRDLVATAHSSVTDDKYLRIWVVKSFTGEYSSIGGYSSFPGVQNTMNGVVMRYDFFGISKPVSAANLPNLISRAKSSYTK